MVQLKQQDILEQMPEGPFDIIFCENLVAMYFQKYTPTRWLRNIADNFNTGGVLLLVNHETFD